MLCHQQTICLLSSKCKLKVVHSNNSSNINKFKTETIMTKSYILKAIMTLLLFIQTIIIEILIYFNHKCQLKQTKLIPLHDFKLLSNSNNNSNQTLIVLTINIIIVPVVVSGMGPSIYKLSKQMQQNSKNNLYYLKIKI